MSPQFPVYIPSKGRAKLATTPHVLDHLGIPSFIIVEASQRDEYAKNFDPDRLLVLDPAFQRDYDTCDPVGDAAGKPKGSGPARNFAWAHALDSGAEWHWIMDDNIRLFARFNNNQRLPVADGHIFAAMEEFTLRYTNVGQSGPEYWMFAPSREKRAPITINRRLFSCILIRNDVGIRWRGRYNEDLDLSISMLRAGWCTIRFSAFLQYKTPTGLMAGGNTDTIYVGGTGPKSRLGVAMNPDVVRLDWRYGRIHHHADFRQFDDLHLIKRPGYVPPAPPRERLVKLPKKTRAS